MGRIFAVVMFGAFLFAIALLCGVSNMAGLPFTPRVTSYQVENGECWVHPQGDPLYDEHYAKEVNIFNCKAYEIQADANNTNADTRRIDAETTYGLSLGYGVLAVVVIMIGLLLIVVIRG